MMKNYKKLIFKERRYSFRHEREAKEEKIIYVPYVQRTKKVHTYVLQKHVDLKKPCIE